MEDWRLRLLKNVQYACQLGAWGLVARSSSFGKAGGSPVDVANNLEKIASLISLSRRSMRLGEWIEGVNDLKDSMAGGKLATRRLQCFTDVVTTISDLAEDVRDPFRGCHVVV